VSQFEGIDDGMRYLLPCHPQFDHHPLVPVVIDQEMAMDENVAVFFKMRACNGFTPRMIGIEGCVPQDDILAVECAVTLANRHRRLPRVVPHCGKTIRFGIEAGDAGASAFRSVRIEESKIRLQKLTVLDHVLLARAFGHDRLPIHRKERLDDVPVARKLRKQLLTGAWCIGQLVLTVGLLRDYHDGDEQRGGHPFPHSA
jgi:hypothetical protein